MQTKRLQRQNRFDPKNITGIISQLNSSAHNQLPPVDSKNHLKSKNSREIQREMNLALITSHNKTNSQQTSRSSAPLRGTQLPPQHNSSAHNQLPHVANTNHRQVPNSHEIQRKTNVALITSHNMKTNWQQRQTSRISAPLRGIQLPPGISQHNQPPPVVNTHHLQAPHTLQAPNSHVTRRKASSTLPSLPKEYYFYTSKPLKQRIILPPIQQGGRRTTKRGRM